MRQQLGVPADVPLIGCAARLMSSKGQTTLLEAFALVRETLPAARLVWLGSRRRVRQTAAVITATF